MKTKIRCFLLALGLLVCSSAHATTEQAKALFERAAQAYREGRYTEAVDLFLAAYESDPHPALVYNVGQAYEKAGDVPNALRSYRRYLRLAPRADDRPTVETHIKNLEQRLRARGVQQVTVFSTPAGAEVILDDKAVGKTPWTSELAPGRHVVLLRHPDFPDTKKEFLLNPDRSLDLDVTLGSNAPASSALPAPSPPPPRVTPPAASDSGRAPSNDTSPRIKPWTWAALGVGAASLGGALAFELSRKSAEDDARNASTQLEHQDRYSSMESRQTTARVLLGVGAVASVAGGVLLGLDLSRKPEQHARVGVWCAGDGCGAAATGSF